MKQQRSVTETVKDADKIIKITDGREKQSKNKTKKMNKGDGGYSESVREMILLSV